MGSDSAYGEKFYTSKEEERKKVLVEISEVLLSIKKKFPDVDNDFVIKSAETALSLEKAFAKAGGGIYPKFIENKKMINLLYTCACNGIKFCNKEE